LTLLGFLLFLRRTLTFLDWIWAAFLRPPKDLKEHYGSWAVLTGPTDGIGKALAFELASRGLNLVLVGRSPSKLRATTDEIYLHLSTSTSTHIIIHRMKKREEILGAIRNGIEGLDVGILVNNAGVGFPLPMFFHEMDAELVERSLRVNVEAASWVAKAVVPAMLRKGRGAVVNVGSGSSVVVPSYPLMTVYGATKAYVAMLSRCMSWEYKPHGIDIQCQIPLFVSTKMTRMRRSRFMVASAEEYARASLRGMGYEQLCCPLWTHSLQWAFFASVPDALLNWFTFRYFLQVRERGLAKAQARS
ncbi:unnamed protein product, partial [Linum tenue]